MMFGSFSLFIIIYHLPLEARILPFAVPYSGPPPHPPLNKLAVEVAKGKFRAAASTGRALPKDSPSGTHCSLFSNRWLVHRKIIEAASSSPSTRTFLVYY